MHEAEGRLAWGWLGTANMVELAAVCQLPGLVPPSNPRFQSPSLHLLLPLPPLSLRRRCLCTRTPSEQRQRWRAGEGRCPDAEPEAGILVRALGERALRRKHGSYLRAGLGEGVGKAVSWSLVCAAVSCYQPVFTEAGGGMHPPNRKSGSGTKRKVGGL